MQNFFQVGLKWLFLHEIAKIVQPQRTLQMTSMMYFQRAAIYARRQVQDTVPTSELRNVSFWFKLESPLAKC